jgi:hypothetical protein
MMKELDMSSTYEPTTFAGRRPGTAKRAIMAGLLTASLMTGAVSLAAVAIAKGQEGGVVCTGTQMTGGTCRPQAMQATPIGSVPLGCQPSSGDSIACGRRGFHVFLSEEGPSAGSAVNGPAQAAAQAPAGRHGAR